MSHHATRDFWTCYRKLPEEVQQAADKGFALLKDNPRHPSLRFKKVGEFWSARVGSQYRALAIEEAGGFIWFWIGTHAEYDRLLA
ncbi:MAG: type II toxin-antitoxin system RelE family toxin [Stenotrophobium sp.]